MAKNKRDPHDPAFEIAFLEKVIAYSPNFIQALTALAELYTKEGRFQQGLEVDRRLAQLRPDEPVVLYNLACSLSLTGDIPGAMNAIKAALLNGYEDLAHLEKDRDLLNLFADPAFQQYYRGIKAVRNPRQRV